VKILIIQTAFIGDVILATPLIENIRRMYPQAQMDLMVRQGNQGLLEGHPHLRQVLVWDKTKAKYRNLWQLLLRIRRERYDWVINCQRFAASGLLTVCSGGRKTAGFDKNPCSRFFHITVRHQIGEGHEVDRNLLLLSAISGMPVSDMQRRPQLYPSEAAMHKATEATGTASYLCIAPTSVWFTKQWPEHKWIELIGQLPVDLPIMLLGSKADWVVCERIRTQSGQARVKNLAGTLNLLESAAVIGGAQMNYVNDSAPMHLASAVNAPVTAVFCSTLPSFGFTPLSERSRVVETPEALDCRPCGLHGYQACPKGHFKCAETIKANTVIF
jgi:lipopolysaccharide heptosyltransferase II